MEKISCRNAHNCPLLCLITRRYSHEISPHVSSLFHPAIRHANLVWLRANGLQRMWEVAQRRSRGGVTGREGHDDRRLPVVDRICMCMYYVYIVDNWHIHIYFCIYTFTVYIYSIVVYIYSIHLQYTFTVYIYIYIYIVYNIVNMWIDPHTCCTHTNFR